jgi:hypothetical protein
MKHVVLLKASVFYRLRTELTERLHFYSHVDKGAGNGRMRGIAYCHSQYFAPIKDRVLYSGIYPTQI